jgi:hypothetical protein
VSDSPFARTYLEWSDLRAVQSLGRRWLRVSGIGTGQLGPAAQQVAGPTKINVLSARQAITIGQPPNQALRFDGGAFDASAISAALRKLGARQVDAGGQHFLALGAEHSVNVNSPLAEFGVINELDRVVVTEHTVAAGPAQAPVVAILGGGRALGAVAEYKAAAGCLGSVVAAVIAPGSSLALPAGQLVAIGEQRPPSGTSPVNEMLCTVGGSAAMANRQVAAVRRALAPHAVLPGTQEPAGSVVAAVSAGRADADGLTVVRALITLRPTRPAGFLYELLARRYIGPLLGG